MELEKNAMVVQAWVTWAPSELRAAHFCSTSRKGVRCLFCTGSGARVQSCSAYSPYGADALGALETQRGLVQVGYLRAHLG